MCRSIILLVLICGLVWSAEIDRICIVTGRQVITVAQIHEELRVTAFLNGEEVNESDSMRAAAASRLIDQALIEHDLKASHFASSPPADIDAQLKRVSDEYADVSAFKARLARYKLSEAQLRDHLQCQLDILRYISCRFPPKAGQETDQALNAWLSQMRAHTTLLFLDPYLKTALQHSDFSR